MNIKRSKRYNECLKVVPAGKVSLADYSVHQTWNLLVNCCIFVVGDTLHE